MFVCIEGSDGRVGCGEASLNGQEGAIPAALEGLAGRAFAAPAGCPEGFAAGIVPADMVEAAAVSAIDQALWDLHAQGQGRRLADALGGACRESIPIYANINRRTEVRTPAGFARSANEALAAGFTALKIAPFDEVDPTGCAEGKGVVAMQTGLERIAAVRAAAGPDCRLMVDCHWRFDEATARELARAAAAHRVYWIECPLPETEANLAALVRLRGQANALGMRLAGLEQGIRFDSFRPFCAAGAYDVMMPDVKYIGGLREMLCCADEFRRFGVEMSPHNPTGPISHAASLQVAAAMPHVDMLEHQFDESPLFDSLVCGLPPRASGCSVLPAAAGLGVRLDMAQLERHADGPTRSWEALTFNNGGA